MICRSFVFALVVLAISDPAMADWQFRPKGQIGFTSNANLEEESKDSDWLTVLSGRMIYLSGKTTSSLNLSYQDYLNESQNDSLSWHLNHARSTNWKIREPVGWNLGAGGQHYIEGSPANSEENFDYIYLETSLDHALDLSSDLYWQSEAGYNLRRFLNFDGRTDHTLFWINNLDWSAHPLHVLSPHIEIQLVRSSDSLYSKNVVAIGADWSWSLRRQWQLNSHLLLKSSTYPNRTVSSSTAVAVGRGHFRTSTQTENERHTLLQLEASAVKLWSRGDWGFRLTLNNQRSRSGFEDYSEMVLMSFITAQF